MIEGMEKPKRARRRKPETAKAAVRGIIVDAEGTRANRTVEITAPVAKRALRAPHFQGFRIAVKRGVPLLKTQNVLRAPSSP
jgi:1-acyl-sn-glycerol-3-phosphate acyltransferase